MALNKRGGELFMKDFRKLWRKSERLWRINQLENCFSLIPEINRLFLRFNQLFSLVVNEYNLKHILKSSGKEISTQTNLYWFTLIPRATSSPQKSLGILLCNQSQITKHTKNVDLKPLKNTQHSLATQVQKYSYQGRRK